MCIRDRIGPVLREGPTAAVGAGVDGVADAQRKEFGFGQAVAAQRHPRGIAHGLCHRAHPPPAVATAHRLQRPLASFGLSIEHGAQSGPILSLIHI